MYHSHILSFELLTFQIIASVSRPRLDSTSRPADISQRGGRRRRGQRDPPHTCRGRTEGTCCSRGGGSCAPVPRLPGPQRLSLSQLRARRSRLPVPDSTFPAFPSSRGSASAGRAAGGSSKRWQRSARAASTARYRSVWLSAHRGPAGSSPHPGKV